MTQEIMILKLPGDMEAADLEKMLVEKLQLSEDAFQVVEVKKGKVTSKIERSLKKEVLNLVGGHAKYHEELRGVHDIRDVVDRFIFSNYFKNF